MYEKKQIKKKTKIVVSYPVPIAAWSGSDASRSAGVIREWGFAVPTPVGHVGCVCPASSATRRARSGCRRRGMPLARASAGLSGSELQVAPRSAVWKPAAGCPALNRASGSELQVVPRSTVWKRAASSVFIALSDPRQSAMMQCEGRRGPKRLGCAAAGWLCQ